MFKWLKGKKTDLAVDGASNLQPARTYLDGAYRLHRSEDVERFTSLAVEAFPTLAGRITCFGSDWAGNQFATDEDRLVKGERQILLLELGTGEALHIPAGLDTFHIVELIQQPDAVASVSFFKQWLAGGGQAPGYGQCVGYKKPLFLGGEDAVSNLEIVDFEVYWAIVAQILDQTKGLPVGTKIGSISIGD